MTIATTMCKLLLAMVIGFFLFKKGILNTDTNKKISAMIVQVTCPCIILNSVSSVPHDDPGMVLKLFLAGVVLYVILPILSVALIILALNITSVPAAFGPFGNLSDLSRLNPNLHLRHFFHKSP